ncbi:MAG: hypothetical protein WBA35_09220 [Litorimonas sp.]
MKTYSPTSAAGSIVEAWLGGAWKLREKGDLLNLILHSAKPRDFSEADRAVMHIVDGYLRGKGKFGLDTVANTIFPMDLYDERGQDSLYSRYLQGMPRQREQKAGWGRYFERLIDWPIDDPKTHKRGDPERRTINQLKDVIEKLALYSSTGSAKANYYQAYELATFDPRVDRAGNIGRQCLSLIELKPVPTDGGPDTLHMTAFYRNHYYISRTLGNMLGLSGLLSFISENADLTPGTLTIVSSHGELDGPGAKALIADCKQTYEE